MQRTAAALAILSALTSLLAISLVRWQFPRVGFEWAIVLFSAASLATIAGALLALSLCAVDYYKRREVSRCWPLLPTAMALSFLYFAYPAAIVI